MEAKDEAVKTVVQHGRAHSFQDFVVMRQCRPVVLDIHWKGAIRH